MAASDLGPLFAQPYPQTPGYARGSATSRSAARGMVKGVNVLHTRVLLALLRYGPMNADEVAKKIDVHFLNVRPRCTELRQPEHGELVVPTGEVRPSALGNDMDVLRLTEAGENVAKRLADVNHDANADADSPDSHATQRAS